MYTPKAFRMSGEEAIKDHVAQCPLAFLVGTGKDGRLNGVHVPLLLEDKEDGKRLVGHISRANGFFDPALDGAEVLAVFASAGSYISPSWYPGKKRDPRVVPTWNYSAVHIRGRLRFVEAPEDVLAIVRKLTEVFEKDRPDPWSVDDAPADFLNTMARAIVGLEIAVTEIEGKAKQSQNRSAEDRAGVEAALAREGRQPARGPFPS